MKLLSWGSLFGALRYPLSMKCYLPFCETLNPSCIYSVRNCRIDLSALGFRNVYTEASFSLSTSETSSAALAPAIAIHGHCLQLPSSRAVAPRCRDSHWSDFAPFLECVRGRVRRPEPTAVQPRVRFFVVRLYRAAAAAAAAAVLVHVIHPCCELAVVRIRVFVSRPRSLPSCSRTKL